MHITYMIPKQPWNYWNNAFLFSQQYLGAFTKLSTISDSDRKKPNDLFDSFLGNES